MNKKLLPLLPRHGVFLGVADCADPERFARVFRVAWARIPLWARRRLLAAWRSKRQSIEQMSGGLAQVVYPWITVSERFPSRADPRAMGVTWTHELSSKQIAYRAPIVDALPDDLLAVLISHELVHHVNTMRGACEPILDEWDAFEEECEVRALNEGWGFDEGGLTAWAQAHPELFDVPEE